MGVGCSRQHQRDASRDGLHRDFGWWVTQPGTELGLVSWGYDLYGQVSDTPDGMDFTAIAAGGHQLLGSEPGDVIMAFALPES